MSDIEVLPVSVFVRRCVAKTWQTTWEKADTFTTGVGIVAGLVIHYVPKLQASVDRLLWQVPLIALGAVSFYRLLMSPYWVYRDRDKEAKQLELALKQLTDRPKRDWPGDWKELSAKFDAIATWQISAFFIIGGSEEYWDVRGNRDDCDRLKALFKQAGDMLLRSPNVSGSVSPRLRSQNDSADRWLCFLKERQSRASHHRFSGAAVENGNRTTSETFSVPNVASTSANLCLECAGEEY